MVQLIGGNNSIVVDYLHSEWSSHGVAYMVLYAVYCPFATCFYCLFVYVLRRHWTVFQCPHYIMLIGLSVCDFIGIVASEVQFLNTVLSSWRWAPVQNLTRVLMFSFAFYSSLLIQSLIAVNRFVLVAFYVRYPRLFTIRRTVVATIACVVVGVLLFSPVWVRHLTRRPPLSMMRLHDQNDSFLHAWNTADKCFSIVACAVMVLFYTMSMRYSSLTRQQRQVSNNIGWTLEVKKTIHGFLSVGLLCINQIIVMTSPGSFADRASVLFYLTTSPTLCLLLDYRLRKRYFELFRPKARVAPRSTTVSTVATSVCEGVLGML